MGEGQTWAAEYVAAKLREIEEALEVLDRSENPLAYGAQRAALVEHAARLMAVLATYEASEVHLN
ncbi:MAG TPA: hypothetical protein VI408_02660 [Gaiellaceae bacterium]